MNTLDIRKNLCEVKVYSRLQVFTTLQVYSSKALTSCDLDQRDFSRSMWTAQRSNASWLEGAEIEIEA